MRVLLVTQYFPPEVGATQNRLGTFAAGLVDRGHHVTVVCEQPNHPAGVFAAGYGHRPLYTEREPRRTVHRTWVAASPRKGTLRRLAFYGSFATGGGLLSALIPHQDVVFASSPPLPGALTAGAAAALRRRPFVLDVRDLWPAAAEALGELTNARVLRFFERAERRLYGTAHRVTATTRPFCRHIDAIAGPGKSTHLPNGALDELLDVEPSAPPIGRPFTVGYAGNFGIAQGLGIVPDAADVLGDEARFVLVGDGPVKGDLADELRRRGLGSVELRPSIPTRDVGAFLGSCDALLVPLRDHPLLRDFIPSKLYDAMAAGRPVLVAAAGEPHDLVREHACGLEIAPQDGPGLAAAVRGLVAEPETALRLGRAGREAARHLVRSTQVDRLEAVLLEAAASGSRH